MKRNLPKKGRFTSVSEPKDQYKVKSKKLKVKSLRSKAGSKRLIVILGPTASGKTRLAVKLAKRFKGEIISADSRQVYRGMDIGTGKDLIEYRGIPYHLIDIVSPKTQFTLAQYQAAAYRAIDDTINREKIPFLVGGTGLYMQSVIDGYIFSNTRPDKSLRAGLGRMKLPQLQNLIKKYRLKLNDSEFNNPRRLIRHLEIYFSQKDFRPQAVPRYDCLILGLRFPKSILDKRIDERLKNRLAAGLVQEVKKLKNSGLSWKKLESFGLEYKWVSLYLQNKIDNAEMEKRLAIAIHQFAKRQMTWFKRMKNILWLDKEQQAIISIKKFLTK